MTQFKAMKMRINNPDHSKAVQEWLFEQGYIWSWLGEDDSGGALATTPTGHIFSAHNVDNLIGEKIDVSHLDPHLHYYSDERTVENDVNNRTWQQSPCNLSIRVFKETSMKSSFENMLDNLKHLQRAIDKAENKQNKRIQDRDRMIEKINVMLPEGFVVNRNNSTDSLPQSTPISDMSKEFIPDFDPEEIVEGSVWECVSNQGTFMFKDCTVGKQYVAQKQTDIGALSNLIIYDDAGDSVGAHFYKEDFLGQFKRVA